MSLPLFSAIRRGMATRTWRHVAPVLWAVTLMACSGQSCSGCGSGGGLAPIPGGYPTAQRLQNAVQLRVAQPFFTFLSNNLSLLSKLLPGGGKITVPADCSDNPQIWCGSGGCNSSDNCDVSLTPTALQFTPNAGSNELGVTLQANIKLDGAQVHYTTTILGIKSSITCNVSFDTTGHSPVGLTLGLQASTDPATQLSSIKVDPSSISIQNLDAGDINISGNLGCDIVGIVAPLLLPSLEKALTGQLAGPLNQAFCEKCTATSDCLSPAATSCASGLCSDAGGCVEFLGVAGQLNLGAALGALAPAAAHSALDIYAAAGSYATVETVGGLSLGLIGGALSPSTADCVPAAPPPTATAPAKQPAFAGNAAPNGMPYAIGAGISTAELNQLGYGFYQSGGLCLAIGTEQVALLSSSTLSILIRSLADLTNNQSSSVQVVLRPQHPPVFTLGQGTFTTMNGMTVIDKPLLTVAMPGLAIDFYLYLDEHYVRLFRLSADVSVPLGIDVNNMGQLVPILGDLTNALQNIQVTDTVLLKETPAELSALFPSLLPALLGQIGGAIKPISLPSLMGIQLTPVQITSVADNTNALSLLGLFLGVGPTGMVVQGQVETSAQLVGLEVPPLSRFALGPLHDPANGPRATIAVQAQGPAGAQTEWQYAVDDGLWRPFGTSPQLVVDDAELQLPGEHHVDVRARVVGQPYSLDPTPARVTFTVMPVDDLVAGAGGPAGPAASGCSVQQGRAGGSPAWALLLGLPLLAGGLLRRRLRRAALVAAAALGACSSSGGSTTTMGGALPKTDEVGKYESAVVQGSTIYVSAYDSTSDELAFAKVTDMTAPIQWGSVDPGPGVGRFTSLGLQQSGNPVIAYQDVTGGRARLAVGSGSKWTLSSIAEPPSGSAAQLGLFNSLVLDSSGVPTVAYMASGVPKGDGSVLSELVVATASSANPMSPGDWTQKVVDTEPTACIGLCPMGQVCTYADPTKTDPTTSVCKATGSGCSMCATGTACVSGACVDDLSASAALALPQGTGLFAHLVQTASGLQVFWYSQVKKQLLSATGPDFGTITVIDGNGTTQDVGQYVDAVAATDGTIHVVYQDNISSQLLYKSVSMGKPEAQAEMVDDGTRGTELDYVGAGAQVFLDGTTIRVVYQDQTAETLESASKAMGGTFMHMTQVSSMTKGVGFYPQVVQVGGQWVALDVAYDWANSPPLSSVEFDPL